MLDNINQILLENLCEKIGIPVRHGWKKALATRLNQKKQSAISSWIGRGFPKEFESILERAGIDSAIWREIVKNVRKLSKDEQRPKNPEVQKGGDETVEGWKLACKLLQEENARLHGEIDRLVGVSTDRTQSDGT